MEKRHSCYAREKTPSEGKEERSGKKKPSTAKNLSRTANPSRAVTALPVTNAMSEKLRLQEPIRSPLETPRLITPLPYRSGTSFLAWAIVNNNQPVPDVFSKMTKIAASGRLGLLARRPIDTAVAAPQENMLEHGIDRLPARTKIVGNPPRQRPAIRLRHTAEPEMPQNQIGRAHV